MPHVSRDYTQEKDAQFGNNNVFRCRTVKELNEISVKALEKEGRAELACTPVSWCSGPVSYVIQHEFAKSVCFFSMCSVYFYLVCCTNSRCLHFTVAFGRSL